MNTVIFTFGTDRKYPFTGGWVKITAPNRRICLKIFKALYPHPEEPETMLNCAFAYDIEDFNETDMARNGNFGNFCHKEFVLQEVL